ncbi:hypothetical protein C446_09488 [Halobiforma nitratireducens JCM 10879]|uniref:Uncharacterized protein n=1 Tax=Halobiforma nitratireducens JCM 10879 TaxID=1227454 RepID=M0M2A9_9EURY|nr:hypothetical protein C446_09488 [Halobiforma nitratireducens JCM 10879]
MRRELVRPRSASPNRSRHRRSRVGRVPRGLSRRREATRRGRRTLGRDDAWRELVVDPPGGVYVPPNVDEMRSLEATTVDGRRLSVHASRPTHGRTR